LKIEDNTRPAVAFILDSLALLAFLAILLQDWQLIAYRPNAAKIPFSHGRHHLPPR
jgi:hypothetical protein